MANSASLTQALQYAYEDALAVVQRVVDEPKGEQERTAAFLVARAVMEAAEGTEYDPIEPLCPARPDAWEACQPVLAQWKQTMAEWLSPGGDTGGATYQFLLSQASRRKDGVFYTPEPLASFLTGAAMDALGHGPPQAVLDPSCGSGRFLVAALRLLRTRFGLDTQAAVSVLHGVERDPYAAALARLALLREAEWPASEAPKLGVRTADALAEPASEPASLPFADPSTPAPLPTADVLLGNPPYGARIRAADAKRYASEFALATGRFDIVSLFVELAERVLAAEGVIAYVLPHAFTRSGGYEATRAWLLERGSVCALVNIGREFPDIDLNTCALVWRRTEEPCQATGFEAHGQGVRALGRVDSTFYRGRRAWPIYITPANIELAKHMESGRAEPLESLARITRGATIKGLSKRLCDPDASGETVCVVRGRDIRRFGVLSDERVGRIPVGELPPDALKLVLDRPRIVLQNIGDRIKATLCPAGFLPVDTVNVVTCDRPELMYYLLAYLNSALVDRYVRDMILNRADLTVHFDRPTIGPLPVRIPSPLDLEYYDRTVPMLLDEEHDPSLLEDVQAQVLSQYEVDPDLAAELGLA